MGAWDYGYYSKGTDGRKDPRLAAGIVAVKNELKFRGYARPAMVGDLPYYGSSVANSVGDFQEAIGLTVDRELGPKTAKELFRKRVEDVEDKYGLPRGGLGKRLVLESNFDPVAVGTVDNRDRGIAQINIGIHSVTEAQAYDPAFAIDWSGNYVRSNYENIEHNIDIMKAAQASYNIGVTYARMWLLAGFPGSGGPSLGGEDSFTRATRYIELINKQSW